MDVDEFSKGLMEKIEGEGVTKEDTGESGRRSKVVEDGKIEEEDYNRDDSVMVIEPPPPKPTTSLGKQLLSKFFIGKT